jgi:hypothetical protein
MFFSEIPAMPDQPSWIEHVPKILETLESIGAPPFLDRSTVEMLFGVRRRQAIHLLRRFGGYQVGKTFLVPRETVIRFLRDPQRRTAAEIEKGRFERVGRVLGQARQELYQRRIPIAVQPETFRLEISGLPDGIDLETGQLIVRFKQPIELLQKLFALSQALANDFETFERSCAAAKRTGVGV